MSTAVTTGIVESWQGTTYGYSASRAQAAPLRQGAPEAAEIDEAIRRSRQYLLGLQHREGGYWVGEVESNSTITSEYIYLMHFMGTVDELRQRKMVHYLQDTSFRTAAGTFTTARPGIFRPLWKRMRR